MILVLSGTCVSLCCWSNLPSGSQKWYRQVCFTTTFLGYMQFDKHPLSNIIFLCMHTRVVAHIHMKCVKGCVAFRKEPLFNLKTILTRLVHSLRAEVACHYGQVGKTQLTRTQDWGVGSNPGSVNCLPLLFTSLSVRWLDVTDGVQIKALPWICKPLYVLSLKAKRLLGG